MLTNDHLFFRFGKALEPAAPGFPIVCLNGGIMADTGNEKKNYIFFNQDRYPLYAAMGGMRCLIFTYDDEHMEQYCKRLAKAKKDLKLIESYTGPLLAFELPVPLFLHLKDTHPFKLITNAKLKEQALDPAIINPHVTTAGIYLNQISPTISGLLSGFYKFLLDNHINLSVRLDEYERMAHCALKWHDKANYVKLIKNSTTKADFPDHVPTAVLSSRHMDSLTWDRLKNFFSGETRVNDIEAFYIKSNIDTAGEVSAIVNKTNFSLQIHSLKQQIALKITAMERTHSNLKLLIQPYIKRSGPDDFPKTIGITYNILDKNHFQLVAVIGQVYEDREYKTFIGSYMSDKMTDQVMASIGKGRIKNLVQLFADQGYRGPVNLDAIRNNQNKYQFIYDCNPRLGGTFPGLILKKAFEKQGLIINNLLTLGYRGRIIYPDLASKLDQLKDLGLLYTKKNQKGIYIIPSIVRPQSFDIVLINLRMDKMRSILNSNIIDTLSDPGQKDLKGIYL
ncbi:MAG: hypothetical protein GXP56_16825 [Deltaproteobacteria bacterium]|nr:hypothetical protein [Deltaproteobacteria bacterium]